MRLAAALLAFFAFFAAGGASPASDLEFFTGQALFDVCSAKPADPDYRLSAARCSAYVMGVSDAQQALQGAGATQRVCLPAAASVGRLTSAVSGFLAAHAEKRPMAAQDLVIEALSAEYPCR